MSGGKIVDFKIYALIRYLQKAGGVTVSELVSELGAGRSSVYRYLGIIEEMGFPLTSEVRNRKTYYFFDVDNSRVAHSIFENLPLLSDDFLFDKDEKMLIEYLFTQVETIPALRPRLEKLHEKMKTLLSFAGHVADDTTNDRGFVSDKRRSVRVMHTFNDLPKNSEGDKMDIISKLCDAVADKKVCNITYQAVGSEPKSYPIMPLIVFSYMGGIYTIVETVNHDYTSKLAVERFIDIEVTDKSFERKTTLDVNRVISDPFGLAQGDQFEATIKINKKQAPYITCREWPKDRVSFSKPDEKGDVTMHVITSGEYELIRWLRYLGDSAELKEPIWLKNILQDSIQQMVKIYDFSIPDNVTKDIRQADILKENKS